MTQKQCLSGLETKYGKQCQGTASRLEETPQTIFGGVNIPAQWGSSYGGLRLMRCQ